MDILRQSLYRIKHGLDTKIKNLFINEQSFLLKAIAQGILKQWYSSEDYFKDEYIEFYNVIYRVVEDTKAGQNPINTPSKFQSLTGGTGSGWVTSGNTLVDNNSSIGSLNNFDFSLMRNNTKLVKITATAMLPNLSYDLGSITFPFNNIISNEVYAKNLASDSVVYTTTNGKLSVSSNFKFYDTTLRLALGHGQTPDGTLDVRNVDNINNTFSKFVIGNDNTGLGDSFFNSISQEGRIFGINQFGGTNYLAAHLGINYAISSANGTTQYAVEGSKYSPFIELDAETGAIALYGESGSGGDFRSVTANLGTYIYRDGRVEVGSISNITSGAFVITSTTKTFVPPRMNTTQMNNVVTPVAGSFVFNNTTNTPHYFNGSSWVNITVTSAAGSDRQIQYNNSGNFGATANFSYSTNGNLLLGTSSDIGGRFRVVGTGNDNLTWTAQFHNSTGISNTLMLSDSGNVMIGTNVDAGYRLDVNGTVRFVSPDNLFNTTAFQLSQFQIRGDGSVFIGTSTSALRINTTTSTYFANTVLIGGAGTARATQGGAQVTIVGPSAHAEADASAYGRGSRAASGTFVSGSVNTPISNVYFGSGINRGFGSNTFTDGNGVSYTINGSGAFGTNFAGGNLTLAGGKPTGNGLSGDVIFSTATTGASGATLRTLTDRWAIKGDTGHLQALGAYDINLNSASALYLGDEATDGTWKIVRNGTDLEIQLRVSGTYITKGAFTP